MKKSYHIIDNEAKQAEQSGQELAQLLSRQGQWLLPLVELVEQCRCAVDEVVDVTGRATIQAILELSAQQVTGGELRQRGKRRPSEVVRWGRQAGRIRLSDRQLKVRKPRLRTKQGQEATVPAYEAMQDDGRLSRRMLEIVLKGVSTRNYEGVLREMAETVGVSKSSVSRETVEAAEQAVQELCRRRFEGVELLVIYIDGMSFGDHTVIAAVGVDGQGHKHVLGVVHGATENAAAVEDLLTGVVERGVDPKKKRLFVIDGSKALRSAIRKVFGSDTPVQRCRSHKLRNVVERLPQDQRDQVKAAMRAAWRLDPDEGSAKLEKLAQWLERDWPQAAASLREGLEECFTINRMGVPPCLHRCLATTNIIESPQEGVRRRTRRVTRWRDGEMVLRWVASSFLDAEKSFRKIMGYRDLWMLQALLNPQAGHKKEAA